MRLPARSQFEVVDAAWDDALGAEALDQVLLEHFAAAFAAKHARNPLDSPKALAKLRRQARLACSKQCARRVQIPWRGSALLSRTLEPDRSSAMPMSPMQSSQVLEDWGCCLVLLRTFPGVAARRLHALC